MLTFAPGQTSKPISLTILGDVVDEEDEIFSVTLSNPDNATLGTATASMLITDNDPAPTISVADISTARRERRLTGKRRQMASRTDE